MQVKDLFTDFIKSKEAYRIKVKYDGSNYYYNTNQLCILLDDFMYAEIIKWYIDENGLVLEVQ